MLPFEAIMRFALLLAAAYLALGQGTEPKTAPSDYPVQVQMESVTLAAEYLVHSLPTPKGTLIANDYLVVEAAFFGPMYSRLKMSPDNFQLRINARGEPLTTDGPGMVSQSIKFPGGRPHLETTGSVSAGDGTVSVGPRPPQSRFPGDGNDRLPANQPATDLRGEPGERGGVSRASGFATGGRALSSPLRAALFFLSRENKKHPVVGAVLQRADGQSILKAAAISGHGSFETSPMRHLTHVGRALSLQPALQQACSSIHKSRLKRRLQAESPPHHSFGLGNSPKLTSLCENSR